jgi:hypothetical protein
VVAVEFPVNVNVPAPFADHIIYIKVPSAMLAVGNVTVPAEALVYEITVIVFKFEFVNVTFPVAITICTP